MRLVKLSAGGRLAVEENRYLSDRHELVGLDSIWNPLLKPFVTQHLTCCPYDGTVDSEHKNLTLVSSLSGTDYFLPSISEDALFLSSYREHIEFETGGFVVASEPKTVWLLMDKKRFPDELTRCGLSKFLLQYEPDSYPQIVKPRNGVGGKGIKVIHNPVDKSQIKRDEVAQNYDVDASILSSENVFDLEGNLIYSIPFFVQEVRNFKNKSFISKYDERVISQIREMFDGLIAAGHRFQGCVNVDFIQTANGDLKVIDFNVRRSGFHIAVIENGLNYYEYLKTMRQGVRIDLTYDYPQFEWAYNWDYVDTDVVQNA